MEILNKYLELNSRNKFDLYYNQKKEAWQAAMYKPSSSFRDGEWSQEYQTLAKNPSDAVLTLEDMIAKDMMKLREELGGKISILGPVVTKERFVHIENDDGTISKLKVGD